MTVAIDRISPAVSVNGTDLPTLWLDALIGMRIELGLCIVGRAVLRFTDVGYALSAATKFDLGTPVAVSLHGGETLFSGLVTGTALEQSSNGHPELVVTVDDQACKMALGTKIVTFEQQTYGDIAGKLASSAGLSASADFGTMSSVTHAYLLQRSTDLAFLDTITRRANCVWWIVDKSLKIAPAGSTSGTATATLGSNLLDFSVRASGLRPVTVAVNGWDPAAQQDITDGGSTPTMTANSTFVTSYLGSTPGSKLGVSGVVTAGEGNPNVSTEAGALASSINTEFHAGAVVARGTSIVDASIAPMAELTVSQAGPASGTYTISEVEHVFRSDGFYTRFVAGPVRPSGLVDTLGHEPPDSGFTIAGLMTATVSDVKDPDNQGRVRVKYTGAGGQLVSAWARVVSMGGGTSRGSVMLPEVGDEVLVGFERGDSRHPVVIGGLFSAKTTFAADSKVNENGKIGYRRITSRLGHVLEFGDGEQDTDKHILMKLGGAEHSLRLGADAFALEIASGKPLSIKAGPAKFEIDAQGNITIEGSSISMKATKQAVSIEAAVGQTTVKGTQGVSVQGLKVDVKADTQLALEGSAQASLKGGIVMIN